MATVTTVGAGGGVSGSASTSRVEAVAGYLRSLLSGRDLTVYMNLQTGSAAPGNVSVSTAAQRIRDGAIWVDYGQWPWGQFSPIGSGPAGFGGFLYYLGVSPGIAGGFSTLSATKSPGFVLHSALGILPGNLGSSVVPEYQYLGDPFDFDLADWTWAVLVRTPSGTYPYGYGLPTTSTLSAAFRPMPGAPQESTTITLPGGQVQRVHVYSAFAIRAGKGWYFEAQPEISSEAYAEFIASVLSGTASAAATHVARAQAVSTSKVTAASAKAASCLNVTVREGSTGGYVAALQSALRDRGYNLGTTGPARNGVDGDFGPITLSALEAFQRANEGRSNPCGRIVVDGVAGPAVWYALGVTGPRSLPAASTQTHAAAPTTRTTHVARAKAVNVKRTTAQTPANTATAKAKGLLVEYEDSVSKALHIPAGTVLPLTGAAIVGVVVLAATNKK